MYMWKHANSVASYIQLYIAISTYVASYLQQCTSNSYAYTVTAVGESLTAMALVLQKEWLRHKKTHCGKKLQLHGVSYNNSSVAIHSPWLFTSFVGLTLLGEKIAS